MALPSSAARHTKRALRICRLDHLVITTPDVPKAVAFYRDILGMTEVDFKGRKAVRFGQQKINFHPADKPFEPKALKPTVGSQDLCFIIEQKVDQVKECLEDALGSDCIEGGQIYDRTGARNSLRSIYIRDPDDNLIELANEVDFD